MGTTITQRFSKPSCTLRSFFVFTFMPASLYAWVWSRFCFSYTYSLLIASHLLPNWLWQGGYQPFATGIVLIKAWGGVCRSLVPILIHLKAENECAQAGGLRVGSVGCCVARVCALIARNFLSSCRNFKRLTPIFPFTPDLVLQQLHRPSFPSPSLPYHDLMKQQHYHLYSPGLLSTFLDSSLWVTLYFLFLFLCE